MNISSLINYLPETLYWMDITGKIINCNKKQLDCFGLESAEQLIGKDIFDVAALMKWPEEVAQTIRENDLCVLNSGTSLMSEEVVYINDQRCVFLTHKHPWIINKRTVGIIGIGIDITEKKRAETLVIEKMLAEKKIKQVETFAGALAHELRTPLAGIKAGSDGLALFLPKLVDGFKHAQATNHIDPKNTIHPRKLALLDGLCERIQKQSAYASLFIDMALMNIRHKSIDTGDFMTHSIKMTINDALNKYPLEEKDKPRVLWDPKDFDDFTYYGDQMLTIHIVFNLLKNSLFYIFYKKNATITFRLATNNAGHELRFTDTGAGIPADILPNIFEPFYTKRTSGSGVGLAFCKLVMEAYGGDIICESKEGEYTTFILQFPKILQTTGSSE